MFFSDSLAASPSPLLAIRAALYLDKARRKTKNERGEGGFCHCVIWKQFQTKGTNTQASFNNLSMIPPLKKEFV
jgi:hypothetical protein